jgi:hypothetical protein
MRDVAKSELAVAIPGNEDPFFVGGAATVKEIVEDPASFIRRA